MRKCVKCGKSKPPSEFHKHSRFKDGLDRRCKDCVNTRPRKATSKRINRNRARHRAVQDLIDRHKDEFEQLLEVRLAEAEQEATELATAAPKAHRHIERPAVAAKAGPEPLPRLRPGARRSGQSAVDRLDVARCPHCRKHHDRGHQCEVCGARPGEPLRPDTAGRVSGVDLSAFAEFNAGTQRARTARRSS